MVWKEVHNIQVDHLKMVFTVVSTTVTDQESIIYKRMYKWCKKLRTRWGVGCLEEYDYHYTFRFWTETDSAAFAKKFKKHVIKTEIILSKN